MRRRRWLLGTISSRCSLFASVLILLSPICSPSSENDRAALLQFKSGVSSDPAGLLSMWRDSAGSDHCSWPGVSCDARSRVSAVNISGDNGGGDRLHDSSLPAPLRRRCSDPAARLAGRLSPAVGRLSELKMLALPCHSFDGEIPGEIWGLQNLEVFDLHGNSLSGVLPSRMPEGLRVLNLAFNRIRGEVPSSLSRCLNLEMVDLSGNHINGAVPPFFAHLPKLRVLSLSFNRLRGSVPGEIGNGCRSLEHLDLSGNLLVGEIPAGLGNCRQLRSLLLFSNLLGGLLPPEIGRLTKLQLLDVSRNRLSGLVPEELGNCVELSVLVLSNPYRPTAAGGGRGDDSNHFGGGIPESVTGLSKLRVLWAPRSKLKGRIPSNWGACERLQVLNLAENLFTGNIPAGLERCKNLEYLNLSSNFLTGGLKEGLPLHSMNVFDVSGNRLSGGPVPRFSSNFLCSSDKFPVVGNHRLSSAYCSFFASSSSSSSSSSSGSDQFTVIRRLTGRPPSLPIVAGQLKEQANSAFMATPLNVRRIALGSPQLYNTTPPEVSPENSRRFLSSIEIASVASAAAIVAVLLGLVVLYVYTRNCAAPRAAAAAAGSSGNRELTLFTDIGVPLTYELVVRAAGNFNASNCIGSGGFGATYKAEISPGVVVAIKRLSIGRFHGVQQFQAEIKTLGRWRHPNLVTLIGFHVSEAEMFLIYNFLPGGNLEKFIQARRNTAADWRRLHRIALDVAQALAYLHDDCSPRILHRDVKPSNILLDRELNAYLSDFGLARLLGSSETHATTGVAGTFGYVAPEYAMTCRVSDKADVYSYGVVLLELLSDKKALDPSFSQYGNGFNIVAWGSMLLQRGKAREFFADGLWDAAPHDDLVETLHLAVMCTLDSMSTRPTMKQVVHRLKQLRPPAPPPSPPYMS